MFTGILKNARFSDLSALFFTGENAEESAKNRDGNTVGADRIRDEARAGKLDSGFRRNDGSVINQSFLIM